jgi:hypothetical protein
MTVSTGSAVQVAVVGVDLDTPTILFSPRIPLPTSGPGGYIRLLMHPYLLDTR